MANSDQRQGNSAPGLDSLPSLDQLHLRHPGLTPDLCRSLSEAARVCLGRHHTPPTDFDITRQGGRSIRQLNWIIPDDRLNRAYGNRDDATRDGAYSLSLSAIEAELGLVAVGRADVRTGVDYYLALSGHRDLEASLRLEVSGIDHGDLNQVRQRLREKVAQARRGKPNLPALASVVGFRSKVVAIEDVGA